METHDELVLGGGLHQALDERMPRQNGEGGAGPGLVAQLAEHAHQLLEAKSINNVVNNSAWIGEGGGGGGQGGFA